MLTKFARSVASVARTIMFLAFAIVHDLSRLVTGARHRDNLALLQELISEAEEGDAEAQNSLAEYYRFGWGAAPEDPIQAVNWFRRAAEHGHSGAQNQLGEMLKTGQGDLRDAQEAAKWFQKAANQGHVEAQTNLGSSYLEGDGVLQSYTDAIKWFRRASGRRDAHAQFGLAKMYAHGTGVPRDDVSAFMWCEIALRCANETWRDRELGHYDGVPAVQGMVERSMRPDEITKAQELAQQWLEEHGVIEIDSETSRQEHAAERKRLTEAAEKGDAQAQYDLGIIYLRGKGAKRGRAAASWIRKAAEQGHAEAQNELGNMLTTGISATRDLVEAASWYRRSAEQGNVRGQQALSRKYLSGQGVPRDYVQAHLWLSLAKANGDETSDNWLNVLTTHMTADQIAEADRLASEWLAAHGK